MTRRLLVGFLFTGTGPRSPGRVLLQRQSRGSGPVLSGFTCDYPVGSGKAVAAVLAESLRNKYGIFVPGNLWECVADVWAVGLRADVFRVFAPTAAEVALFNADDSYEWADPCNYAHPIAHAGRVVETLPLMLSVCLSENYAYPVILTKRENNDRTRKSRRHQHAGEPAVTQDDGPGD